MAFTKQQSAQILKDFTSAFDEVAKKHGLKRGKARLTYGLDNLKITSEFLMEGGRTKEEITYERYQRSLGLPPLGTRFGLGTIYETAGLLVGGPYKSLVYRDVALNRFYKQDVFALQQRYPNALDPTGKVRHPKIAVVFNDKV